MSLAQGVQVTVLATESLRLLLPICTLHSWYTLYPLYFSSSSPLSSGRRIPASLTLHHVQSLHIAKACSFLGLKCVHEVEKTHPADWRNPGRVKVRARAADGGWMKREIGSREFLVLEGGGFTLVAREREENRLGKFGN